MLRFSIAVSVLLLGALSATGQQWTYSREDDPLHAKAHDRFTLSGKYLTPPRAATNTPSIVVECSGGKVEQNYIYTGAVVVHRDQSQHGVLVVEARIDGKKNDILTTGLSTDGLSAFFDRIDLKAILSSKQVMIGVYEYLGSQVIMQFDMPDPAPVMDKCGSDRILRKR